MTSKPPLDDEDGYIGPWEDPPSKAVPVKSPSAVMSQNITVGTAIKIAVAIVVVVGGAWIGWTKFSEQQHADEQAQQQADAAEYVKTSLQDEIRAKYYSEYGVLQVRKVTLIRESDHKFTGTAMVWSPHSGEHSVSIDVTADGENVMWETERGSFVWLADEPKSG